MLDITDEEIVRLKLKSGLIRRMQKYLKDREEERQVRVHFSTVLVVF